MNLRALSWGRKPTQSPGQEHWPAAFCAVSNGHVYTACFMCTWDAGFVPLTLTPQILKDTPSPFTKHSSWQPVRGMSGSPWLWFLCSRPLPRSGLKKENLSNNLSLMEIPGGDRVPSAPLDDHWACLNFKSGEGEGCCYLGHSRTFCFWPSAPTLPSAGPTRAAQVCLLI